MNGNFDSNQIAVMVKQYFEKLGNVFLFRIEKIYHDKNTDLWTVECSFFDTLLSDKRSFYKVDIDGKEGKFKDVSKLQKQ